MNKYVVFFLLSVFILSHSTAQIRSPRSYALVIGVSKYEDPKITSLNYAHKDASAFADFCLSDAGLDIPNENIRTLTNEKASYWNIIDGLDWLKSSAQKDDKIYIYFAGHGDMESKELKYGYLLAYDSRFMNYLGRSLSLDLLNKTAHTLSVNKKANVFLITDACHSGKLAGVDFNGSNLVALNLMQLVSNNEVRITSCNEGELSYEDELWGDGRGAFSYFLTKGMSGEADGIGGKKDGNITIGEIKTFLNGKVPDEVRTVKSKKQSPVIMGTETTILNPFKASGGNQNLAAAVHQTNEISSNTGSRSVSTESTNVLEQDIMNATTAKAKDRNIDFKQLSSQPAPEIVNVLLEQLILSKKINEKILSSVQSQQMVAKALYQEVQHIIDLYLSGDEAELEKRRYYNQVDRPYEQYPYMLDIAIKLLPEDHGIIPSLQMQRAYLGGLNYRIQAPFKDDYKAHMDTALLYQKKALAIDSRAAYIQNELGILYNADAKVDTAIAYFQKAISIAPLWSLPYANLANAYYKKGDFVTSKKYVDIAFQKQKTLQNPYIVDGNLYMTANNYLFAEEQFQKAIKINNRHFSPFDRLGELYLKVQDFQTAEQYYYEGAIRKMGLNNLVIDLLDSDSDGVMDAFERELAPLDTNKLGRDIISCFLFGKVYFDKRDFRNAKRWFDKVVNLDVNNPLVYHYLGQLSYASQEYALAEYYFRLGIEFHLQDSLFQDHVNKVAKGVSLNQYILQYYYDSRFDIYDAHLYLARTYDKWNYHSSAVQQYKKCIDINPKNKIAYQLLWNLYKSRLEPESAEDLIYKFGQYFPESLDNALADYYEWALAAFEEDLQKTAHYSYKYGLLLHQYITSRPTADFGEIVTKSPDNIGEELEFRHSDGGHKMITFVGEIGVVDVEWSEPKYISYPISNGIKMFKKVIAISVDKDVRADSYAKMGDMYIRAASEEKALENYELSLDIKPDNNTVRSNVIKYADRLYLFQSSFDHLKTLEKSKSLTFEDGIILARYYMKYGDKGNAIKLSDGIFKTHPFLQDKIEGEIIKLYLRFGDYKKVIVLLDKYIKKETTDPISEYMLARANAGLKKPKESLKHLKKAEDLGFDLGFVYTNDVIFDPYRRLNKDWTAMQEKMERIIKANVVKN